MLKQNTEFRRIYYRGSCKSGRDLVVYAIKGKSNEAALGITVSKKVGNAVVRNRTRRIILTAYRQLEKEENFCGYRFVIVARKSIVDKKSTDLYDQLKSLIPATMQLTLKKTGKPHRKKQ